MSIENNLKRIADSLEGILAKLDHIGGAVSQSEVDEIVAPKPPVPPSAPSAAETVTPPPGNPTQNTTTPAAPVTPAPPVTETVPSAAPVSAPSTPPAPAATMTADELNAALVTEFKRLGKRDPIDAVLREFGVQSITELKADQYQAVIDKVKAVTA